jgi:hypothetical protein
VRALTAAQQAVVDSGNQAEWARLWVKDAGGTWRDLTSYPGFNAVKSLNWSEQIDNPQATFDAELFREFYAFNLSPFVAGSPINKGFDPAGGFAQLLDLNREVKIEVAIVPMGMKPAAGDWVEYFTGRIDTLDAASGARTIKLGGRGMVGRVALQYIREERVYSFAAVTSGPTADALAAWTFDANSSHDDTGNGHDGTDTHVSYGTPSKFGAAAQFDGTSSNHIAIASPPVLSGAWTMAGWVYLTAVPSGSGHSLVIGETSTGKGVRVSGFAAPYGLNLLLGFGFDFQTSHLLNLNTWYSWAVSQNANGGDIKFYIDGVYQRTAIGFGAAITPDTFGLATGYDLLSGATDLTSVWNRQLSDPEVLAFHNLGASLGKAAVSLRVWEPNMVVTDGTAGTELTYVLPASRGWDPTTSQGDPGAPGGVPMFLKCTIGGTTGLTEPVWTTGAGQSDGTAAWDYVGSTTDLGNPVEQVMQNLLDDWRGIGDSQVALYTPTSPAWAIREFLQQRTQALDAVRTLAQQIGWDVRPKWRSGTGQFELTFYQPERTSPPVDFTFGQSDYGEPQQLAIDISQIRNHWFLTYSDASDTWPDGTPKRKPLEVKDDPSIARFGDLIADIQEDSASQIDSSAEGTTLINSALSDCSWPTADMQVPLVRGFPWVELNDYFTFAANGQQFDSDQSLAVTGYRHSISGDKPKLQTSLTVRGKPTIGAKSWLANIIHPRVPPKNHAHFTGHRRKSFPGKNTPFQSLSLAVGGTHGLIKQSADKNRPPAEYEVHIYPVSGTALSSSTLYAVTKSISNQYIAGLVPGQTYFMVTVPRYLDGEKMDRGGESSEQSFIAGQALAGHLSADPDLTRLPLNGGFETNFAAGFPPDHWGVPSGAWGTDVSLVTGSGGVTGGNYVSFANNTNTKELASDLFPIEQGALYSLSAWVNENNIGGNGQAELKWYDSSRAAISGSEIDLPPPGGAVLGGVWVHRKGAGIAPPTARFARVRIFNAVPASGDGFLVDKLEVKRLTYCGALIAYAATLPNTNGTVYLAPSAVNTLANELIAQLAGEVVLYGLTVTSRSGGGTIDYTLTVDKTLAGTTTATPITVTLSSGALTGNDLTNTYANASQIGGTTLLGVSFKLVSTVVSGTPAPNQDVLVTLGIWQ